MNLFEMLSKFIRLQKYSRLVAFLLIIVVLPVFVYVALQPQNIISKAASKFGDIINPAQKNAFGKLSGENQKPSAVAVATNKKTKELKTRLSLYAYTPGFVKPMIEDSLETTAKDRYEKLQEQLETEPEQALENILTPDTLKKVPQSIEPYVEKEIDVQGTVYSMHIDDIQNGTSREIYSITTQNKTDYEAFFGKIPDSIPSGTTIQGKGILVGDKIAFLTAPEDSSPSFTAKVDTSALTGQLQPGEQKLLFVPVKFSDISSDQSTLQEKKYFEDKLFNAPDSLNEYYKENSYYNESSPNGIFVSGRVNDWITVSTTPAISCDLNGWSNQASSVLSSQGTDIKQFDYVMYYFPQAADKCPFGGAATSTRALTKPYALSWMISIDQQAILHEFGHNLGIAHANALVCPQNQITDYASCINTEGGDQSSLMSWSGGLVHFDSAHKTELGWIPADKIYSVSSGTAKVNISPLETSEGSLKVLRVLKADTGESYYISYRQPVGFDKNLPSEIFSGAQIHILLNDQIGLANKQSVVLPWADNGATSWNYLVDGRTFVDKKNNITIKQLSHSASGVSLEVTIGISGTNESTEVIPTPSASPQSAVPTVTPPSVSSDSSASLPDFYIQDIKISGSDVVTTICNKGESVHFSGSFDTLVQAENGKWRRFGIHPIFGDPIPYESGSCVNYQTSCTQLGFFCSEGTTVTGTVDENKIYSETDEENNVKTITLPGNKSDNRPQGTESDNQSQQQPAAQPSSETPITQTSGENTSLPDFYIADMRISDPNVIMTVCNKGNDIVNNNPNSSNFGQPLPWDVAADSIIKADNGKWRRFVGHAVFGEGWLPVRSGACTYLQARCTELGFFCDSKATLTGTVDEQNIYTEYDESNNTQSFAFPRSDSSHASGVGGQIPGENTQHITLFGAYIYLNGINKNQLQVVYNQTNSVPTYVTDAASNTVLQVSDGFTEFSADPSVGFPRERTLIAFSKKLKGGDKIKLCTVNKLSCSAAVTIQEITIP